VAATAHRQFLHALMICEVLASIELGTRELDRLRFIGWPEILARAPEDTHGSPMPLRLPLPTGGYLVPDGVFGIEYRASHAKSYRFFALEADRGTMPVARSNPKQTSYMGKLAAYGRIINGGVPKTHWGVPNLLVLTVTLGESRLAQMLRLAGEGGGSPAFLFKAVSEPGLTRPLPELLAEPWMRGAIAPLCIGEAR
jgi:hypothetical protein